MCVAKSLLGRSPEDGAPALLLDVRELDFATALKDDKKKACGDSFHLDSA